MLAHLHRSNTLKKFNAGLILKANKLMKKMELF